MNGFIPYLKAKKLLQNRLGATAEEIAAWVYMGPTPWVYMGPALGAESCRVKSHPTKQASLPAYRHWPCLPSTGLAAHTNANEFDDPPRFHFDDEHDDDYLAQLMGCWFSAVSIAAFQPQDRYITGQALRARWQAELGDQVDAYIRSKILESRLMGFHPIAHGIKWNEEDRLSPKGPALFDLAHIEAIEAEEGIGLTDGDATLTDARIAAIVNIARQFEYDPMSVPYGGKALIERECLEKQKGEPHRFTAATFKAAWQAARDNQLIDVQDVEIYRGR